jgi:diacylglycerol O-acyltransferase / wax synthase
MWCQAVTTNVPGPRIPLYVLGRRMCTATAYVPIAGGTRCSIGIFSYLNTMTFGINADFDAFPDVDVLSGGIRSGIEELLALARQKKPAETPAAETPAAEKRAAEPTELSGTANAEEKPTVAPARKATPAKKTTARKTTARKTAAKKTATKRTAATKAAPASSTATTGR